MKFSTKIVAIGVVTALVAYSWRDTFAPESVRGAKVLVTGASTGIGEQMAYHYARFGAQIVITARRENVLRDVAERCLELGAQSAIYIPADMSNTSDPERVVRFAVNFLSYLQMTSAAMSHLERSAGSIVVVSSLLGKMCSPFVAPYTATKFSLNGFFGTMQHELAMQRKNVSLTISILGLIDTQSALEKIRGYTDMKAYPASEAALHIIKAGATRQRESFYPLYTYFACLIRDWFPFFRDLVIQNSYNFEP
ncbi:hypothetical protein JZ751_014092 [Albula glossodonta]|uniref:Uncharacterized protein n=1 Tax=Albula glossodonta TaxID=121402 RepID=A0A8T2NV57_9TELE|nr:hypothetical protein JZ751_014092 [Albula glossodonta]